MSSQSNKNTSVFLEGDFSRKERKDRKAGGPTSVSATIDRSTWKRVRMGEVLSLSDGDWIESKDQSESGYRLIQTGNIGAGEFVYHQERARFISAETFARLKCTEVFSGDCLISRLPDPIGRACILPASQNRMITAVDCAIARPIDNVIDRRFFVYFTSTVDYKRQMEKALMGSTRQRISRKSLNEVLIPLPGIEIQKTIVSSLSAIDTLCNALKSLIAKYEAIKKATVNLLLEPHKSIPVVKLGEVADISRGGSPRPIQDYLTSDSDGINWIKIGDVSVDAKYIERTEERIKPTGVAMSRQVKAGDFILSNSMSFGRPYILKIDGCIHDGWLAIQNYQNIFDVDYLYYLLGSDMVFTQYIENAAGSSVKNLNKEIVAKITLPSPPLSEQRKIAEKIIAIDNALADYKAQLEKARQLKAGMMSYFFG